MDNILLDVVFKFGDHFYKGDESDNSVLWPLILTFIGAFLGYLGAIRLDRLSSKRSKKAELIVEKIRKFYQLQHFRECISAVIDYVPKQVEEFKSYGEKLEETPLEIVLPVIQSTFDLARLKNSDNIDNRRAFYEFILEDKEGVNMYRNSLAHADFLFRIFDQSEANITRSIDYKHKDQLVVKECIDEISLYLAKRFQVVSSSGKTTQELQLLNEWADAYAELISTFMNFQNVKDKFIDPIFYNCLKIIGDSALADKIFILARKAHNRLLGIEQNALHVANDYKAFGSQTSVAISNLKLLHDKIAKIQKPIIKFL